MRNKVINGAMPRGYTSNFCSKNYISFPRPFPSPPPPRTLTVAKPARHLVMQMQIFRTVLHKHLATANLVLATANFFSDSDLRFATANLVLATANFGFAIANLVLATATSN